MSVKTSAKVWEWSQSEGNNRLVLLALADFCDDDGVCYPGVPRLAKKCKISERSVQRAFIHLSKLGELIIERKAGIAVNGGSTNRFTVKLNGGDKLTGRGGDNNGSKVVTILTQGGDTAMSPEPSVEPSVQPSGASEVEFPPVLNNPAFIAAWQLWQDFRKQAKIKAYVPIGAKVQLNRLAKLGSSAAIAAIENSVANGYAGIFEPKQNGASRPTNSTPKPTPADPDGWADWLTAENRPYVPHFYAPSIVKDVFRQGATA